MVTPAAASRSMTSDMAARPSTTCCALIRPILSISAISATVEEIAEIDKMGLIKAQHVVDGLAAMSDVIDRLAAAGVTMSVPETTGGKPLDGKTYVVSGSVPGY